MVNELDQTINYPPLHFAVLVDGDDVSEQLVQVLIEHGADITFKDGIEQTVLFYACREGKCSRLCRQGTVC